MLALFILDTKPRQHLFFPDPKKPRTRFLPSPRTTLPTLHAKTQKVDKNRRRGSCHAKKLPLHATPRLATRSPVGKPTAGSFPPAPRFAHLQERQHSADDGRDEADEDGPPLGGADRAISVDRRDGVELLSRHETERRQTKRNRNRNRNDASGGRGRDEEVRIGGWGYQEEKK